MIVRAAGPADHPALVALMRGFDDWLHAIEPDEPGARTPRADAEFARMAEIICGPDPAASALLAVSDGRVVGYLAYSPILWMDDAALALWMSDLYVTDAVRGAGAGRALVAAARAVAAARGARRIVFTVWRLNGPAQAFYERLGARDIAQERLMWLAV